VNLKYTKITSITAVVLLCGFCAFVILFERYAHKEAQLRIEEHGRIIADALWNSNPKGATEYLSLACKSQNYRYLVVIDTQEKHALLGQIAGKMAHDFNNILGVIMGNTELSLLDCKDENIKETLELIYGQTLRGKNLTKNLVVFAKDQEPKQEFFRIGEKVALVMNLLKKDLEGIELIREESPGVPDLLADPGMVEHALVNLVQNSIHALGSVEHPRIIIRTYCSEGHILVDSTFGSGAKFIIHLPVIEKELTSEEKTEILKSTPQTGKTILHVEDEQVISDAHIDHLSKPCQNKEYVNRVNELLGRSLVPGSGG
jgi:signal transduction histidine kinase